MPKEINIQANLDYLNPCYAAITSPRVHVGFCLTVKKSSTKSAHLQ